MLVLQIFFITLSFLVGNVESKEYFSLDQLRLKNGAVIVNVNADWGSDTQVAALFIKNGASLKFDRKTSFSAVAFRLLNYRLQRLAKKHGFIVKSEFTWDYSGFTFYFPKGYLEKNSSSLWNEIFGQNEVGSIELENLKRDVLRSLVNDLNRKFSKMPIISLMAPNSNAYSLGMYGSEDDLKSITEKEFNEFLKCYLNPLGATFIVSGISRSSLQLVSKEMGKNKPCFRDERFFNESINTFNIPIRKMHYTKAGGDNTILRMGFPSVSCQNKDSFAYDIAQQIIADDFNGAYVSHNCSVGGGTLEVIVGGLKKKDINETSDLVFGKLSLLGKNVDESKLLLAKQHIRKKYSNILSKRDELVFLIGKMNLLYGDPNSIINYVNKIDAVKLHEVRRVLSILTEQNSYCVLIRLEG
jgi:hypothetical protein